MISHKFSGGEQFAKALRGLDMSKAKAVKVAMLKAAAEPMRETAEHLVLIGDEAPHIVDRIVVQSVSKVDDEEFGGRRALDADEAVIAVGPQKDFFYGKFIEFGTAPHGNHPGTSAHPFMRPAFDQNVQGAQRSIQDAVWAYIRKVAGGGSTSGRNL